MNDEATRTEDADRYGLTGSFGYWLGRLARGMREAVDRDFAAEGVNVAHWAILAACDEGGRPQRVVDLARRIGVDAAGVTRLIERLAEMGLVERRNDPLDRRAQAIELTDRGRALLPRLRAISVHHNEWWLRELGVDDPSALLAAIRRAVDKAEGGGLPPRDGGRP